MTWTAFWYGIAALFEMMFKILRKLYQIPNICAWVILICLLAFWTSQLIKHKKEVRNDGTYL